MQLDPMLLPDLKIIRLRAKALAMLDAIVCPEWEYRYYSYNAHWGAEEEVGSMRNGSGDAWFLWSGPQGAALKGFAHECAFASNKAFASQVREQVPTTFSAILSEPAFDIGLVSFFYWRPHEDSAWHKVALLDSKLANVDDGSEELLALLFQSAAAYVTFAKEYYEVEIPLAAVESLYRHEPLTDALIGAINSDLRVTDLDTEAIEIGYPLERR